MEKGDCQAEMAVFKGTRLQWSYFPRDFSKHIPWTSASIPFRSNTKFLIPTMMTVGKSLTLLEFYTPNRENGNNHVCLWGCCEDEMTWNLRNCFVQWKGYEIFNRCLVRICIFWTCKWGQKTWFCLPFLKCITLHTHVHSLSFSL